MKWVPFNFLKLVCSTIGIEHATHLVEGNVLHDIDGVLVEGPTDEVKVGENEGLVDVKAESDDVLSILEGQPLGVGLGQVFEQELLIISQLDHQGNVKRVL